MDDKMDYGDSEDDDYDDDVGWSKGKLAAMRDTKKRGRETMENDDDDEEEFNAGGDDSDDEELVSVETQNCRLSRPVQRCKCSDDAAMPG